MDQEAGILAVCRLGAGTGLTAVCRLPRPARREGVSCPLSCSAPSGGQLQQPWFHFSHAFRRFPAFHRREAGCRDSGAEKPSEVPASPGLSPGILMGMTISGSF